MILWLEYLVKPTKCLAGQVQNFSKFNTFRYDKKEFRRIVKI